MEVNTKYVVFFWRKLKVDEDKPKVALEKWEKERTQAFASGTGHQRKKNNTSKTTIWTSYSCPLSLMNQNSGGKNKKKKEEEKRKTTPKIS